MGGRKKIREKEKGERGREREREEGRERGRERERDGLKDLPHYGKVMAMNCQVFARRLKSGLS